MDSNLENELREVFRARLAKRTSQIQRSLIWYHHNRVAANA